MIQFDPTINLSSLISFVGFVIGGLGVVFTLRNQVTGLADRMASVEIEMRKMADVLVQLGRQDERLNAMDRRIGDLSRKSNE